MPNYRRNDDYEKGKEIGELTAEIKNLADSLNKQIDEQHAWNLSMEKEVNLLKAWVQTTTGKVVIITTIFGIVGSACYIGVNWVLIHFFK